MLFCFSPQILLCLRLPWSSILIVSHRFAADVCYHCSRAVHRSRLDARAGGGLAGPSPTASDDRESATEGKVGTLCRGSGTLTEE